MNARSLTSCIDQLRDFLAESANDLFSAICIQEVWSARRTLLLPGYKPLISLTRDQEGMINPNVGGGVGIFVWECIDHELLPELSEFLPGIYESVWVKLKPNKQKKGKEVIIASIYRPNSAPRANVATALRTHLSILEKIKKDKNSESVDL